MHILVTGGAGYIGSHTCIALIEAGHSVVVIDDFSNSHTEALRRVEGICDTEIPYYEGDVGDDEHQAAAEEDENEQDEELRMRRRMK